jgi:hypothetical protein
LPLPRGASGEEEKFMGKDETLRTAKASPR